MVPQFKAYIKNSEYPPKVTDSEKKFIMRMVYQFFFSGKVLYKRNHNTTLLQCINAPEASRLMEEMHEGLLGAHDSGPLLVASSTSRRAMVAKSTKIGRMFFLNHARFSSTTAFFSLGNGWHQTRNSESL